MLYVPDSDPVAEARAALAELEALLWRAATASTPDQKFTMANELVDRSRVLTGLLAAVKTQAAREIWDSERLTLAALADRIGVSTARAHQIIGNVRPPKKKDEDDD